MSMPRISCLRHAHLHESGALPRHLEAWLFLGLLHLGLHALGCFINSPMSAFMKFFLSGRCRVTARRIDATYESAFRACAAHGPHGVGNDFRPAQFAELPDVVVFTDGLACARHRLLLAAGLAVGHGGARPARERLVTDDEDDLERAEPLLHGRRHARLQVVGQQMAVAPLDAELDLERRPGQGRGMGRELPGGAVSTRRSTSAGRCPRFGKLQTAPGSMDRDTSAGAFAAPEAKPPARGGRGRRPAGGFRRVGRSSAHPSTARLPTHRPEGQHAQQRHLEAGAGSGAGFRSRRPVTVIWYELHQFGITARGRSHFQVVVRPTASGPAIWISDPLQQRREAAQHVLVVRRQFVELAD